VAAVLGQVPHDFPHYNVNKIPAGLRAAHAIHSLPAMNITAKLAEAKDLADKHHGKGPFMFAHPNGVSIDLLDNMVKVDGGYLSRTGFAMDNAVSFAFFFDAFAMPEGAAMWAVSESDAAGPWTHETVVSRLPFNTRHIKGQYVEVVYFQADSVKAAPRIHLNHVTTGFRRIGEQMAGTCNINTICTEAKTCSGCDPSDRSCSIECTFHDGDDSKTQWAGEDWHILNRGSVGITSATGSLYCSGAFLNNPGREQYVLTAEHCRFRTGTDGVHINYESQECRRETDPPEEEHWATQTEGLVRSSTYDLDLIEVTQTIPRDWGVFLLGWEAVETPASNVVGIHHPAGGLAKISHSNLAVTPDRWSGNGSPTHWYIDHWTEATTEGGSSGSPCINQENQRVIGQLTGGTASCPAYNGWDMYGGLAFAFKDSQVGAQLRQYLGEDEEGLPGRNLYQQ
jgi:hypothetical protein